MKIQSIKPSIVSLGQFYKEEAQSLHLPTIQREFVWDEEDIKQLIDSIISGYPIGAIIVWEPTTRFPSVPLIGGRTDLPHPRYILDGQQRLTALMLIMNKWEIMRCNKKIAKTPISYVPETNRLYFGTKKGIDVSLIVNGTLGDSDSLIKLQKDYSASYRKAMDSVGQKLVNYQLPIYVMRTDSDGDEDAYEKIAEIFTRVNSAGVKIGNLEMFLSFFASAFPQNHKDKIMAIHSIFSESFALDLEPLVRFVFSRLGMNQNQITKIKAFRKAIHTLKQQYQNKNEEVEQILNNCQTAVKTTLDLLAVEFGVSSAQFIPSQNLFMPLFVYCFHRQFRGEKEINEKDRKQMLYWFLISSFNGVYSSSTNRKIDEDIDIITGSGKEFPLQDLLKAIKNRTPYQNTIDKGAVVTQQNVYRGRAGREFLMLLDILLYRNKATNWAGKDLRSEDCAIHHIFPQEYLTANDETDNKAINCLANLTLVDPEINAEISDNSPSEYLPDYVGKDESIFEKHMIPSDPKYWTAAKFDKFLGKRANMIWDKTKALLEELRG